MPEEPTPGSPDEESTARDAEMIQAARREVKGVDGSSPRAQAETRAPDPSSSPPPDSFAGYKIVREVQRYLLDSVGCAFGGWRTRDWGMVRDLMRAEGGSKKCWLLGEGVKVAPLQAAFLNALAIRQFKVDRVVARDDVPFKLKRLLYSPSVQFHRFAFFPGGHGRSVFSQHKACHSDLVSTHW
ncbi:MAG: MmgE/PrpD family protein [Planctomycetes bacterium]|nr:MmgE/PrpD family protein [Planctomycetota bacterium]